MASNSPVGCHGDHTGKQDEVLKIEDSAAPESVRTWVPPMSFLYLFGSVACERRYDARLLDLKSTRETAPQQSGTRPGADHHRTYCTTAQGAQVAPQQQGCPAARKQDCGGRRKRVLKRIGRSLLGSP
jgi:hypothetical protein